MIACRVCSEPRKPVGGRRRIWRNCACVALESTCLCPSSSWITRRLAPARRSPEAKRRGGACAGWRACRRTPRLPPARRRAGCTARSNLSRPNGRNSTPLNTPDHPQRHDLLGGLIHEYEACGVKKFDSARTAVLVIAAEPVQTERRADVFAVPAPVRPRPLARTRRR
jgi:hypothetical protein